MNLLNILVPQPVTNTYRGAKIAKWIFILLTVITIVRSLAHIILPDGGAQSIATIPLETITSNGAAAVIHIFALWGISQLLFGLLYAVVLWRYQSLIPLMYVFIFIEYSLRLLMTFTKPFQITGTAPGSIANYFVISIALIMFFLSKHNSKETPL